MSMTRQEQFDAVVRNYGAWPVGESLKFAAYNERDSDVLFFGSPHAETLGFELFTRAEVEQRKAELQNKPSWDDAPDWAGWIAQDDDGQWFYYKNEPEIHPDADDGFSALGFIFARSLKGEVIGDWRDTLEKRPVVGELPKTDSELSGRLNSKVDCEDLMRSVARSIKLPEEMIFGLTVDSDQPALEEEAKKDKNFFDSLDDFPLVEEKYHSKWNGEGLPPVGVWCEFLNENREWTCCVRIGIAMKQNKHVIETDDGKVYTIPFDAKFRPIKSGREQWIEDCEEFISGYATWSAAAEAMYNGFKSGKLKMPEVE